MGATRVYKADPIKNHSGRFVDILVFCGEISRKLTGRGKIRKPCSARLSSWWAHTDSNRGQKDYESLVGASLLAIKATSAIKPWSNRKKRNAC